MANGGTVSRKQHGPTTVSKDIISTSFSHASVLFFAFVQKWVYISVCPVVTVTKLWINFLCSAAISCMIFEINYILVVPIGLHSRSKLHRIVQFRILHFLISNIKAAIHPLFCPFRKVFSICKQLHKRRIGLPRALLLFFGPASLTTLYNHFVVVTRPHLHVWEHPPLINTSVVHTGLL